ncbi:uncharacterized protein LOC127721147 [Mytilus californianus]|uniref:uncharacterized protein LOC127721147 n=1 Tax=Mytilus californianus TaxID=6549 RepID=UPI002247507F|nr:uncharacterized protein LOC127721147 [Mytilus californianus]
MAETLDKIEINTSQRRTTISETEEEHALKEIINNMQIFTTETEHETTVECPSAQIGSSQDGISVKIHMNTLQYHESISYEKEEHGLKKIDTLMECSQIDKREPKQETINDYQSYSVEILDNVQIKQSLCCASNNNELDEHNSGEKEKRVQPFQIHNAERQHDQTMAFSENTQLGNGSGMKLIIMDNILNEMQNNMMTPAEVVKFIDLLLEKDPTDLCQRRSTMTDTTVLCVHTPFCYTLHMTSDSVY